MFSLHLMLLAICFHSSAASDAEDFNPEDHIVIREEKHPIHQTERCKCTCPAFDVPNVARNQFAQVYTSNEDNVKDCSCRNVVLSAIPDLLPENFEVLDQHVCPNCKCTYERHNLNVIFGAVLIVSVLLCILCVYLIIYKVLWPKIRASTSYKEQREEAMVLEDMNLEHTDENTSRPVPSSRFSAVNFILHRNSKWQQELAKQQRNIYDDHTMLN